MIAPALRASTTTCRAASTLRRTSSLSVAPAPLAISTTSSIRSEPPNSTDADAITSRVLHRTRSVACAIRFRASSVTTVMLRRVADPRIPEELFTHLLALRQVCREPYVLPGISALAGLAMLLDQSDRAEHYRRADPHSSTNLPASEAPTAS